jgi:phage gp46-like protein
MPFRGPGADIALVRTPNGKFDFDWDSTGNPRYTDDNVHRVMSLLIEHRAFPGSPAMEASPGWFWDRVGDRGSLLYTVKNVRRSTPSELEAYATDALKKAVAEGWISDVQVKAYVREKRLQVSWKNSGSGAVTALRLALEA